MGSQEARVEQFLAQEVRKRGGMCEKLVPARKGMPDRMVIWPGGRICLIEVKTETGRLSAAQEVWIGRAQALGAPVTTIFGRRGVRTWLDQEETNHGYNHQKGDVGLRD
jgi:hypothetical protein